MKKLSPLAKVSVRPSGSTIRYADANLAGPQTVGYEKAMATLSWGSLQDLVVGDRLPRAHAVFGVAIFVQSDDADRLLHVLLTGFRKGGGQGGRPGPRTSTSRLELGWKNIAKRF